MGGTRLADRFRFDVAAATVKVTGYASDIEKVGLGILVGSGYIVTASHCLEFDNDTGARITLGERVHYAIETAMGERLRAAPVFIESVSDIAVLGPPDRRAFPGDWADAYESFCERIRPVPIWRGPAGPVRFPASAPAEFTIHIYTRERSWIPGKAANRHPGHPDMQIRTEARIEGGSSGGPIVNDSGELVGVVTTGAGYLGLSTEGTVPLLRSALPEWIYRAIHGTYRGPNDD